ncbi:sulfatase-like hydrolase/transferase [Microbacterium sp. NPDC076911]|uniref:sulfatase-like hydrolase/transferase n=1 Tax=Microbacterium sp. NPDC076911 TaxID=3154958 RepID=UPI00342491A3
MSRPNVVVIMADQLKATALPQYGNPDVLAPSLDRLADQGVLYDLAFTPHPLCTPSRVSLWTGTYPHNHGVRTNELTAPRDRDNYLRAFHRAGYNLALLGKNHCFGADDLGLFDVYKDFSHTGRTDGGDERDKRFRRWMSDANYSQLWEARTAPLSADDCPAARVTEESCRFIESTTEPFLLWMSLPEPHEPYHAPEPFASMYDPDEIQIPAWEATEAVDEPVRRRLYRELCGFTGIDDRALREAVAMYYAMISFVDSCVGRVLDTLEQFGRHRDTIVVFVSDHGDFGGERGLMVKCNSLVDALTRIPLLVSVPGAAGAGTVVDHPVSLIDVMPTLARLAGMETIEESRGRNLPGLELATQPRSAVFAEYGAGATPMTYQTGVDAAGATPVTLRPLLRAAEAEGRSKMVRTSRWKYIYDPLDPLDELYDLAVDPLELHNLAADPDFSDVIADMRRELLDWSINTEDARPVPLYFSASDLAPTSDAHFAPFGA